MPSAPIVSAIVVSWNTRELLSACLDSLNAPNLPLETFVVDNASADGSTEMVRERFPSVQLIANTCNVGFAAANNQAIGRSSAPYLLLLNPDATLEPGALERLVATLESQPDVAAVGPRTVDEQGRTQSTRRRFPTIATGFVESTPIQRLAPPTHPILSRYYLLDRSDDEPQDVDWMVGACLLVRRNAIDQVGGLDERFFMYFEETDWCHRFRAAGWRVVYEPSAVARHHGGQSSAQVPGRRHCAFNESKCRYVRKWHGLAPALALRWFLFVTSWLQLAEEALKLLLGHKRALRRQRLAMWSDVLRWQAGRLFSA